MGLSTQFVHTANARPRQLTPDPIYSTYIQFRLDWVRVRHLEFPLAISNRLPKSLKTLSARQYPHSWDWLPGTAFLGLAGSQPIFNLNLCTIIYARSNKTGLSANKWNCWEDRNWYPRGSPVVT